MFVSFTPVCWISPPEWETSRNWDPVLWIFILNSTERSTPVFLHSIRKQRNQILFELFHLQSREEATSEMVTDLLSLTFPIGCNLSRKGFQGQLYPLIHNINFPVLLFHFPCQVQSSSSSSESCVKKWSEWSSWKPRETSRCCLALSGAHLRRTGLPPSTPELLLSVKAKMQQNFTKFYLMGSPFSSLDCAQLYGRATHHKEIQV